MVCKGIPRTRRASRALARVGTALTVIVLWTLLAPRPQSPTNEKPRRVLLSTVEDPAGTDVSCEAHHAAHPCAFVRHTDSCQYTSLFNYLSFHYCDLSGKAWASLPILLPWLGLLFHLLGTTAEDYFAPALTIISERLHLPDDVAGVTLLALGNGAPDISSISVAAFSGSTGISVGEPLGAGMFITTVVLALVCFANRASVLKVPFFRDVSMYVVTVLGLFVITLDDKITLAEACAYLSLYFVYVVAVITGHAFTRSREKKLERTKEEVISYGSIEDSVVHCTRVNSMVDTPEETTEEDGLDFNSDTSSVAESDIPQYDSGTMCLPCRAALRTFKREIEWDDKDSRDKFLFILEAPFILMRNITSMKPGSTNWNKGFAFAAPICLPVFVMVVTQHLHSTIGDTSIPTTVVAVALGLLVSLVIAFRTQWDMPPKHIMVFTVFSMCGSIFWMYALANELVGLLQSLGAMFGVSEFILGLTVLAWGNSIGDAVANVAVARHGFVKMAVAACFGGPILNMLLGLGFSWTVRTITLHPKPFPLTIDPAMGVTMIMQIGVLAVITGAFVIQKFQTSKRLAILLLTCYVCFVAVCALIHYENISIPAWLR